jgi:hypothetical protein
MASLGHGAMQPTSCRVTATLAPKEKCRHPASPTSSALTSRASWQPQQAPPPKPIASPTGLLTACHTEADEVKRMKAHSMSPQEEEVGVVWFTAHASHPNCGVAEGYGVGNGLWRK